MHIICTIFYVFGGDDLNSSFIILCMGELYSVRTFDLSSGFAALLSEKQMTIVHTHRWLVRGDVIRFYQNAAEIMLQVDSLTISSLPASKLVSRKHIMMNHIYIWLYILYIIWQIPMATYWILLADLWNHRDFCSPSPRLAMPSFLQHLQGRFEGISGLWFRGGLGVWHRELQSFWRPLIVFFPN